MSTIYCGDNWLASHFGLRYGNVLTFGFLFIMLISDASAGAYTFIQNYRAWLSAGIREFDFGVGLASYKKKYAVPSTL